MNNLVPDYSEIELYQEKLYQTFNHNYEKVEIEQALDTLLGLELQEEPVVYPEQYYNGI